MVFRSSPQVWSLVLVALAGTAACGTAIGALSTSAGPSDGDGGAAASSSSGSSSGSMTSAASSGSSGGGSSGAVTQGSSGAGSSGSNGGNSSSASANDGGTASGSSGSSSGSATSPACTDTSSTAGAIIEQYGSASLSAGDTKSYFLQSNWWQTFDSEVEDYSGLSFTVKNPMNASVSASDGAPMGFPSIFIGQYAGNATMGSNLPKQVSSLTSVPTIYQTNNSSIGTSNHNATYDVWFTQDGTPLGASDSTPGTGGAYLMVWMFKPTDRQPRGTDAGRGNQTIAGVPGTWDVWYDTTNPPCVSYVSSTPIDGLDFDLNDFIKDAVAKSYGITSSMYLSIVFGGFEIWGGADGIQLKQFCAQVN